MASRILHLAVAEKIMEQVQVKDKNGIRLGIILPDAYDIEAPKSDSHLKLFVCGGMKKTYDLRRFKREFASQLEGEGMYLGYYLHLIQDLIFRKMVYKDYKWNSSIPGNVARLHNDYYIINPYVIERFGLTNNLILPGNFLEEKINILYPFDVSRLFEDLEKDFVEKRDGEIFFFTHEMANEFIIIATNVCVDEIRLLREGKTGVDEYRYTWKNEGVSLLKTTQNTRELGGYRTKDGNVTRWNSLLRSDVPSHPCEEDYAFVREHGITTVIDMRGEKDVTREPSGFANVEGINYLNYQIEEGSGVPESVEAVPVSYLDIACAVNMVEVFRGIANSDGGVLFHCTAGKDRTGVVSAILLCHGGVEDGDIIKNYLMSKEYGKERLDLVHQNFPDLDMNIVTPNERFMEEFLRLFRERFGSTDDYFRELGLSEGEIGRITGKLVDMK